MLLTNSYVCDLIVFMVTLIGVSLLYVKHKYNYWKNRGIPQLTPTFPFGNYGKELPRGISIGAITKRYYEAFKSMGCKFGGVYFGLDPHLVIIDPSHAKDILTTDFQYFTDRGLYLSRKDPITVHILSQPGLEWKTTRNKFSTLFTTVKMKQFFNTMKQSTEELKKSLEKYSESETEVEMFELFACYATNIISSVVFGVDANSFKDEDAIFRKAGRDLFSSFTRADQLRLFMTICYPKLSSTFGISNIQQQVQNFFMDLMEKTVEYREKNNIYRQDFLQVLLEMRQSGIDLTIKEMGAQAFLFYSAGFETSSGTATFLLFELGLHQDLQDKVREEILRVLEKYDGDLPYEAIRELNYLKQAFDETLRKYPQLTTLTRVCVKDYTFKNTDVTIKKGTSVLLPVLAYQQDPDYYPDPLKFDPERFADKNVKHQGYFPFGDGPRNCIGFRFGLIQVYLGVICILTNYRVSVSPKTELPLEFDELTFVTKVKQTIYLKLDKLDKIK